MCVLNSKDPFCQYNLIKILLSFMTSVLISGWNWWMNSYLKPRHLSGNSKGS